MATKNLRFIAYYKFVLVLLAAGTVLCIWRRRQARELLAQNPFAAIFCLLFFFAYFVLYAWYDAIIKDARFVLSIFLPFVFAASMVVLALGRERAISVIGRRIRFDEMFAGLLLAFSLIDVLYNAPAVVR